MNIYEKLSAITSEMKTVAKNLEVNLGANKYKAVGELDVLKPVKELEEKHKVYSYPIERKIVSEEVLTKEQEYNGKITRTNQMLMRLEVKYRFVNMEKPDEFVDMISYGDGLDTGDKAPGKAMTYADKYALMKAYKIGTGDDPDQEPSPESSSKEKTGTKTVSAKKQLEEKKATEAQLEIIKRNYKTEEVMKKLLESNGIEKLEDLSMVKASEIITKLKELSAKKKQEEQSNGTNG